MEPLIARPLGSTGMMVSPIGFGSFKIGRNERIKYDAPYELPSDAEASRLVRSVIEQGITLIDTAPAYGLSEARIGAVLAELPAAQRSTVVLATKVGERFEHGASTYDFSYEATITSVERSLQTLRTSVIDIVFVHSPGDTYGCSEKDLARGACTQALQRLKHDGRIRAIGFSGKTIAGHMQAMDQGFDALMVEYHALDDSQRPVLEAASQRGIGVLIKKALGSGRIPPSEAIPFALGAPAVASCVIGSRSLEHLVACVALADAMKR
ncbi:MAG: aldo/keto reductase [Phycisphaerae bacterium]|nr:aldo/keto reductase [Phycisphaerae bacterium]